MSEIKFSFEDLEVWQKAVDFAVSVIDIAEIMNFFESDIFFKKVF